MIQRTRRHDAATAARRRTQRRGWRPGNGELQLGTEQRWAKLELGDPRLGDLKGPVHPEPSHAAAMQLALRPLLVGVLLAVLLGGCAQRTLTITSDPPGALVWLNDAEIGRTPITTEVADYGDYELILRHEGHETLKTSRGFWPAIYMIPPLDFLSELVGARHHKTWNFVLEPATTQPAAGIITRAEEARQQLRSSRHTTTQRATRATTGPSAR